MADTKINRYRVPMHTAIAATECFRVLFPSLKGVNEHTMTPEAAAFIFSGVRRLKWGSAMTNGFFKLYKPFPPTSVLSLSLTVAKSIITTMGNLSKSDLKWNVITYTFVLSPQRRLLQAHFSDSGTHTRPPCPGFRLDF